MIRLVLVLSLAIWPWACTYHYYLVRAEASQVEEALPDEDTQCEMPDAYDPELCWDSSLDQTPDPGRIIEL